MRCIFRLVAGFIRLVLRFFSFGLILAILAACCFIYLHGNQPMHLPQVPAGMTYWQFMVDRLDAAKEIEPKRCGVGRLVTFGILAPVYSLVYTDIGLHPNGFLDRVSQDDPNIPIDVENTSWYKVPDLWWNVFEKISWSMLARRTPACNFRPVELASP